MAGAVSIQGRYASHYACSLCGYNFSAKNPNELNQQKTSRMAVRTRIQFWKPIREDRYSKSPWSVPKAWSVQLNWLRPLQLVQANIKDSEDFYDWKQNANIYIYMFYQMNMFHLHQTGSARAQFSLDMN